MTAPSIAAALARVADNAAGLSLIARSIMNVTYGDDALPAPKRIALAAEDLPQMAAEVSRQAELRRVAGLYTDEMGKSRHQWKRAETAERERDALKAQVAESDAALLEVGHAITHQMSATTVKARADASVRQAARERSRQREVGDV